MIRGQAKASQVVESVGGIGDAPLVAIHLTLVAMVCLCVAWDAPVQLNSVLGPSSD
jgi:hypothetical protein